MIEGSIQAIKNKSEKILARLIRVIIQDNNSNVLQELINNGLNVNQCNWYITETMVGDDGNLEF